MLDITKEEAEYLAANGRSHDIHMSSRSHKGHCKKRFVTESCKTMELLNAYRNARISEVHTREV